MELVGRKNARCIVVSAAYNLFLIRRYNVSDTGHIHFHMYRHCWHYTIIHLLWGNDSLIFTVGFRFIDPGVFVYLLIRVSTAWICVDYFDCSNCSSSKQIDLSWYD